MSFFGAKKASADEQNVFPVTLGVGADGFCKLSETDGQWECPTGGFRTETHTWYTILADGTWVMVQVIYSCTGIFLVPLTTQMTFKYFNPTTKQTTWKSVNVGSFKADGKTCKSDHFEIKHTGSAAGEEAYIITANLDKSVQISATFTRPADAPGFKYGAGDKAGYTFFGKAKTDGFAVHRFQPFMASTGNIVLDGKLIDLTGDACFIHAIQGMRPDSLASRWNFGFFTSGGGKPKSELGDVRGILMEFVTTDAYGPHGAKSGRARVAVGAVYSSALGKPLLVVGESGVASDPSAFPSSSGDVARATETGSVQDSFTGYAAPAAIEFAWEGKRVGSENGAKVSAVAKLDKLGCEVGEGGLIEKVDVLAEVPYVVRKALAAVTGTKPYIYQYLNPATLSVTADDKTVPVEGWLFSEASFISE